MASITLVITSEGSTSAKAAESEPAEHLSEARFLDATGVLVGQSGGMKNTKSSKSWSGPLRVAPSRLETTVPRSKSVKAVMILGSYALLTSVPGGQTVRARCITRTRGNAIVVAVTAFPSPHLSGGARRNTFVEVRLV